jgi:preprotein translocase SecE subunit
VARQTRDERRKRRAQADASASGGGRVPPRPVRLSPEPSPAGPSSSPSVAPAERRRGGVIGAFIAFLGESYAELRKVEWPRQNQVVQGTIVVLVACLVVGFYLWGADQVFKRLVEDVLLK